MKATISTLFSSSSLLKVFNSIAEQLSILINLANGQNYPKNIILLPIRVRH